VKASMLGKGRNADHDHTSKLTRLTQSCDTTCLLQDAAASTAEEEEGDYEGDYEGGDNTTSPSPSPSPPPSGHRRLVQVSCN
jgi:hypothetical protein